MQFERPVETWFDGHYREIPQRMREALIRYVVDHVQPGSFLTAVICNDLAGAVWHADSENLPLLKTYVEWFYNVPPGLCKGSRDAMKKWLAAREVAEAVAVGAAALAKTRADIELENELYPPVN